MTAVGKLLFGFIWFDMAANELFPAKTCLKRWSTAKNNALKIVQEVASHFLPRRASSDSASIWLDIGQFWGNLAKSLTDANLDVDK